MKISRNNKYLLISLLIFLNFIIRVPSVPHEIGIDSVSNHILANSISDFGYAKWWDNPSSIFGFYPYSYASSVPFIVSGISQSTGIEIEIAMWLFCVFIGLFSAFNAYLLAGMIMDNDIFKILVAFSYSLSPGILAFSTWDISSRGLFLILLPLLIYILLKIHRSDTKIDIFKYTIVFIILFVLMMATHHYIFMTVPIIFSFLIIKMLDKLKIKDLLKIPDNLIAATLIAGFLTMFLLPFFTGLFIKYGRYTQMHLILSNNIRYTGILIIFTLPGLTYLLLKNSKKLEEWFLLITLLFLTPLLYQEIYMHYFIIIFSSILIGIALTNALTKVPGTEKRNFVIPAIMLILILSVGFSGFYQHWRTKSSSWEWYTGEATYQGGLWIRDFVDINKKLVGYDDLTARRAFAISEVPTLVGMDSVSMLVYGFVTLEKANISKNSPLSTDFYFDNPYKLDSIDPYPEGDYYHLESQELDSIFAERIIGTYNLSYVIEHEYFGERKFILSLHEVKDNIYNNGKIKIWRLD